ncbi:uncharacterized protein LOC130691038 [Daphnia carinata]|uniref:uncharacterized protein LOC130691038 n=1 Tax=Daphnia carinata TaxID=120202 RepID=UPI00257DE2A6|nr:uncharacterized protein LOC130691038 [Daphnia carinata]
MPKILDLDDLDRFLEEVVEEERIASCLSFDLAPKMEPRGKRVTFDHPNLVRYPSIKPSVPKPPPIRPPPTVLSTQAMRELTSSVRAARTLQSNNDLRKAVSEQMQEVFRSGHVTRVTSTDSGSRIWYLPYHPVQHPSKPNKVRLVYDAAGRFKGMAINDILLKGPDLTTQLLAVLLRFRERRIAVTADIARMFYQVLVREGARPMFRFLWSESGTENPIQEYQMTVLIFGAVSSPTTCSFTIQRLEKDAPVHLQEVVSRIRSDLYVDNLLSSIDEVEDGASTCRKLVELLSLGGFNLVQFLSSSRLLLDRLPSAFRLMPELDLDFHNLPTERTLGYLWNSDRDEFLFRFKPPKEA